MTITPTPPNRVIITCAIAEESAAYQYLSENGLQVVSTEMTGKELVIRAKKKVVKP